MTFEAKLFISETDSKKTLERVPSEAKRIMQQLSEEEIITAEEFEAMLTKWVEWVFREQKHKTQEGLYIIEEFEYDEDVIQTAITDIILTTIGERKMNTRHGSNVIGLVFENKGPFMNAMATREITTALRFNLPVVKVLNVDVTEGEKDNDPVDVFVEYEYKGIRQQASVTIN